MPFLIFETIIFMKTKIFNKRPIILFIIVSLVLSCNDPKGEKNFPIELCYQNPGLHVDLAVGLWASPLPMDYDDDGDLDLVISCTDVPFKGTYFFENKSGEMSASTLFAKPVKIGSGINNITISYVDGKPRVLGSGVEFHDFSRFVYDRAVGIANAEDILSLHPRKRFNHWKYVDYEGDGDLDIIVGIDD